MQTCKFCNRKVEALIDAHIIPKVFFEHSKQAAGVIKNAPMEMVTNLKGQLPVRRTRVGWYDPDLVCSACEERFGPYDDYAAKLLLQDGSSHQKLIRDSRLLAWKIESYDYEKLLLFFVSLLWRAGASELPQFQKINLGPWLDKAKKHILSGDPGDAFEFSLILARFSDEKGLTFSADPHLEKKGGVFGDLNVYRFYLGGGYVAYLKVDKRPFPAFAAPLALKPRNPLFIISRNEFENSKEFLTFSHVLAEADVALSKLKKGLHS